MGKSINVRGRTVDEAIQKGLAELGAARDQVDIVLLSSPGGDPENEVNVQLTVSDEADFAPAPVMPGSSSEMRVEPKLAGAADTAREAEMARASWMDTSEMDASQMASPSKTGNVPHEGSEPAFGEAAHATAADTPTLGQQVLEQLLKGMGIRSQVVVRHGAPEDEGPDFVLDIVGADLGILIGRRGETLRDLEYLTRLIVAQRIKRPQRFAVDVEGYRARRERVLRELAKRMADRVRQNRQPITLEAMPPHERRIVHITLREHPTVRTQSIGEGERRRVMILPK